MSKAFSNSARQEARSEARIGHIERLSLHGSEVWHAPKHERTKRARNRFTVGGLTDPYAPKPVKIASRPRRSPKICDAMADKHFDKMARKAIDRHPPLQEITFEPPRPWKQIKAAMTARTQRKRDAKAAAKRFAEQLARMGDPMMPATAWSNSEPEYLRS